MWQLRGRCRKRIQLDTGGIWRIVGSHWSFRLFPFCRRPEENLADTYQTNWLRLNDALVDVPRQIWHEDFKRPQGPQGFSVLLSHSEASEAEVLQQLRNRHIAVRIASRKQSGFLHSGLSRTTLPILHHARTQRDLQRPYQHAGTLAGAHETWSQVDESMRSMWDGKK
jgi:hypothetical protein